MKQKFLTLIVILGLGVGIGVGYTVSHKDADSNKKVLSAQTQVKSPPAATASVAEGEPGIPKKISIPKIRVDAIVESVGMDSKGRMDTPKDADNTAWFNPGFRPGTPGSAVLDGHYDKESGGPAVFWDLKKLVKGDEVIITDDKGNTHTFAVERIVKYPYDKFPIQEVFAASDVAKLNLITCQGEWDKEARNYSERMVVYTKIVSN